MVVDKFPVTKDLMVKQVLTVDRDDPLGNNSNVNDGAVAWSQSYV